MNESFIEKSIIEYFPNTQTDKIAAELGISTHRVRTIAKKYKVQKSEVYLIELKKKFVEDRRRWYEANIPELNHIIINSTFAARNRQVYLDIVR